MCPNLCIFQKQSYEACAIINLIIFEEETKAQEAK